MKLKREFHQHGDVLVKPVQKLPANAKLVEKDSRGVVLAEGEATGHYHAIQDTTNCRLYEADGTRFLEVLDSAKDGVDVVHQEHAAQTIGAGIYKVGIVQEYDHFEEEAREVRD